MEKKYDNTNTGALFIQEVDSNSKRPTITGRITLSKAVVKELVDELSNGREAVISVAGWDRTSKAGKPFISVVIKGPEEANKYSKGKQGSGSGNKQTDDFAF